MRFVWCSIEISVDEVQHGSMSLLRRAYFVRNEVHQDPERCVMDSLVWKRLEVADIVQPGHPLAILCHRYSIYKQSLWEVKMTSRLTQGVEKTPYGFSCSSMNESNVLSVPQGANSITARLWSRKDTRAVPRELYGDTAHTRQTSKRQLT